MIDTIARQVRKYLPRLPQMLRFGTVGVSGTALNSLVLWLLVQRAGWPIALASALATEAAVVHNFLLNDAWTFRAVARHRSRFQRLLRFNGVSLGGLGLTVGVVLMATQWWHIPLVPANLLASAVTVAWNYIVNSRWTWRDAATAGQPSSVA